MKSTGHIPDRRAPVVPGRASIMAWMGGGAAAGVAAGFLSQGGLVQIGLFLCGLLHDPVALGLLMAGSVGAGFLSEAALLRRIAYPNPGTRPSVALPDGPLREATETKQ